MFVDLGCNGLIWVAHSGGARGLTGLQWQSSRVVWVTGCSGRTCGGLQETKLILERSKKKKKKRT